MLSIPRPRLTLGRRLESTALHFYQNRQLELYAAKETKRLTLRQLVCFCSIVDVLVVDDHPGVLWSFYQRGAYHHSGLVILVVRVIL